VGIVIEFKGEGADEKGYVVSCSNAAYQLETGKEVINVDSKYFRPTEVDLLIGDPSKCKQKLDWQPKYDLKGLVKEMVAADLQLFEKEKLLKTFGYSVKNQFE
jgi:GDPmannose 4,6-dehydratase